MINFFAAIVTLVLLTGHSVSASLIFSDDFNGGTTGSWYTGGNSGTLSNSGTSLSWAENGSGGEEVIGRSFNPVTLPTGRTLRLKFDITMTGPVSIMRAGLFDTQNAVTANDFQATAGTYRGYYTFLRDNSGSANNARFEDDSSAYILERGTTIGSSTTQFDMLEGTPYQVVFDITRPAPNQLDTLISFNSSDGSTTHMSVTGSTTTLQQTSFDGAFIRTTGGPVVLDNISVNLIPEPSSMALFLLGILGLVLRGRRIR